MIGWPSSALLAGEYGPSKPAADFLFLGEGRGAVGGRQWRDGSAVSFCFPTGPRPSPGNRKCAALATSGTHAWQIEAEGLRAVDCLLVTRIGMPHHPRRRIIPQDPLQPCRR